MVGVDDRELCGAEDVVDDGGVPANSPQSATAGKVDQLVGFDVGQPKGGGREIHLVRLLGVDDPGGAVGQQSLGERDGFRSGGAHGAEVGDSVDDSEVGDTEGSRELRHAPAEADGREAMPKLSDLTHPAKK